VVEAEKPFFSIVVPCFERPDDLRRCLASLEKKAQTPCPDFEIIVTDDSKSENCRTVVEHEFPNVSWGPGKQNGPAGNRNAGVDRAKGEWIVFLDDDCIAQKGYLAAYSISIRKNPHIFVYEGRIFPDRPKRSWAEGCPENEKGGMLWTSNLCIKKSLFQELLGFDENFEVAFEDVDFAYRIKRSMHKTFFVYNASVCHPWRSLKTGGKNWKKAGYELESIKLFTAKHGINEVTNWKLYLRYLLRMITTDQIKSILNFRFRGYSMHLLHIYITISTICFLIKFEWTEKLLRK
jgi:GT2 family glycosyltransferase